MKNIIIPFLFILSISISYAQVGIGTTNPQGALDVNSTTMGIVLPRVSSLEDVTNADGSSPAIDGTIVYDISRKKKCHRINGYWVCTGVSDFGILSTDVEELVVNENSTYFKASNTDFGDSFGRHVSISDDGNTMAISAYFEDSNSSGINGDETDNSATRSGAVFIFNFDGFAWMQEAYIKASNPDTNDFFGQTTSLSGNGNYLVVGARFEDSNATGVNGDETDNSASASGAAYVFFRTGSIWVQQAYLKASNSELNDFFGWSVAMDDTGSTLVIGGQGDDSNATGINGNESDNSANAAGAAYVFTRSGVTWSQQAYLKASNTDSTDEFGIEVTISGDGSRIGVGSVGEQSNAVGVNGDQTNNTLSDAGAVYIFSFNAGNWSQEAYIKASFSDANDKFGSSLSLTDDGSRLAVGVTGEDSFATGMDGNQTNNSRIDSGAVYIFSRTGVTWSQEVYMKTTSTENADRFGTDVAFNGDGTRLVVSSTGEDGGGRGPNTDPTDNSISSSGAAYVFSRSGTTWSQLVYLKSSNSDIADNFGSSVAIDGGGTQILCGASQEGSNATGIGGIQTDNSVNGSGASYLITVF